MQDLALGQVDLHVCIAHISSLSRSIYVATFHFQHVSCTTQLSVVCKLAASATVPSKTAILSTLTLLEQPFLSLSIYTPNLWEPGVLQGVCGSDSPPG